MKKQIIGGLVFAIATFSPLVTCLAAATSASATSRPVIVRCIGDTCSLGPGSGRTKPHRHISPLQRSVNVGVGMATVTSRMNETLAAQNAKAGGLAGNPSMYG